MFGMGRPLREKTELQVIDGEASIVLAKVSVGLKPRRIARAQKIGY